jgi:hypothetical protein
MNWIQKIFNTDVQIHEPKEGGYVETWDGYEKQKWYRNELPLMFDGIKAEKGKAPVLDERQSAYIKEETRRCREGFYFMNNGVLTYITGKHYFYIQWWRLEDDIYPEFRDVDRRWFLFLNFWERVLWCLGVVRGKKRREGASSQATSNLIYECIFYKNTNSGLVSKSDKDGRETFTEMVAKGYRELPFFLKPIQLNREDSVTELVFEYLSSDPKEKSARSKVNYRAPVLNAYDRGRLSRALLDEFGKLESDIPASILFAILKKTLTKGVKRVGFVEMPSTVNSWKKGGAEFKKIWDGANQFQKVGNVTANRLVKYLSAAWDGYEGFIDEYGMSVVDEPTKEQFKYLVDKWVVKDEYSGDIISELTEEDIRLGSKQYVLVKRRAGLTGTELEEEIRQNPCDENEMFMAANADCAFDGAAIAARLDYLKDNPVYKRSILFYKELDGTVKWRDAKKGEESFCWKMTWFPPESKQNKSSKQGLFATPENILDGAISVDSYSNTQGGRKYGSKASALMGRKFDIFDPLNSGKAFGQLYGRPAEKDDLHEQVLLGAIYMGYRVWYEHTADDYYGYFKDRGALNYLGLYPMNLIDPTKKEDAERHKGTPLTGFSLSKQMDYAIAYFRHHCNLVDFETILENALIFDPYKRTEFDTMVSFLILLACLQQPIYVPKPPKDPLIKMYGDIRRRVTDPSRADY